MIPQILLTGLRTVKREVNKFWRARLPNYFMRKGNDSIKTGLSLIILVADKNAELVLCCDKNIFYALNINAKSLTCRMPNNWTWQSTVRPDYGDCSVELLEIIQKAIFKTVFTKKFDEFKVLLLTNYMLELLLCTFMSIRNLY